MKSFPVAGILCATFSWTAFAQTAADAPATKEDIEKYFEATHTHDLMLKMMDAMSKPMHQMAHDQCAKIQVKLPVDCEAQINRNVDDMMKQIPFDELTQAMVPSYEKHFTKGDMDALIAFYSAPTGQKILQEMPAVMADAMEAMMPIMRKTVDKMTERAQQQLAQMMKDSPNKPGDSAASAQN
ncbi:MAG: DUF2059 domain-containing protein [Candidatus Sulfotelmatobacter sp.]